MILLEQVKSAIKNYSLIAKKDKVIVAVSGGPDSLALLYSLNKLKDELGFSLHLAHLDHGLRKNSSKDRKFVESLAEKLRLKITAAEINLKALVKYGSIEDICRRARLGFLFRVAKEIKANKIALGHNLDDQAETVLMRLIRGSGLSGLSGILPKRKISGYWVIRPLLGLRRREIEAFLKKIKIKSCQDETNKQNIHLRNKIRNHLIPLLEKNYNKNVKEALSNIARTVGSDYDYLKRDAVKTAKRLGRKISLEKFLRLHPAMQNMVLRLNIERLKGDTRRIDLRHIKEIHDLIFFRPAGSIVDLPGNISVIKKGQRLFFKKI